MSKVVKRSSSPQPFKKQLAQLARSLQHLQLSNIDLPSLAEKDAIEALLTAAVKALSKVEQLLNTPGEAVDTAPDAKNLVAGVEKPGKQQPGIDTEHTTPKPNSLFFAQHNKVQYANASLAQLLGYSSSTVLTEAPLSSILPLDFTSTFEQYQLQAPQQSQEKVPGSLLHKDGTVLKVHLDIMLVPFQETPVTLVMVHPASPKQQTILRADQQERMEYLLKESPAVVYTAQARYPYATTFISENIRSVMGYEPDEHLQNSSFWLEHIHPEDVDAAQEAMLLQVKKGGGGLEYRYRFADGVYHWLYEQFRVTYSESGEAIRLVGSMLDISAKKEAERKVAALLNKAQLLNEEFLASQQGIQESLHKTLVLNEKLEASETFNRLVISSINEGVVVYDTAFRYRVWNAFMEKRFGYTAPELMGKRIDEVFPYVVKIGMMEVLERALQGETVIVDDTYLPVSKTQGYWVTSTYSPLIDSHGEIIGVVSTVGDVTERRKAEEEKTRLLERKQQLLKALEINREKFKGAQLIAGIRSWEYDLLTHTGRWADEEIEQQNTTLSSQLPPLEEFVEMLVPEHRPLFLTAWQEAVTEGKWYDIVLKLQPPGMPHRWERAIGKPLFDESGNTVKVIGVSYDLTEQKNAEERIAELLRHSQDMNRRLLASEEELTKSLNKTLDLNKKIKESEQRWQFALGGSGSGVWDWDLVTNEAYFNDTLKELLGYKREQVITDAKLWMAKIHPEDKALVMEAVNNYLSGASEQYQVEYRIFRRHEEDVRWVLVRGKVTEKNSEGKPLRMIGTMIDITEQKHYEVSLANAANYLDKIINTILDPIFVKDRQHKLVLVNDACCEFLQKTREELLGKDEYQLVPKKSAAVFWHQDEHIFTTGEDDINEEALTMFNGEVRTIITKKSLYIDSNGRPFVVGTVMDITDQKALEQRLKEQNENLTKINAELDSFVYRTSHDLRSPLASVLGLINISRLEQDEQERLLYLDLMEKSIRKLDSFIHDIINYAKNARVGVLRVDVDLELLVQEIMEGLKFMEGFDSIEKKIELEHTAPFYSDLFRLKIIFNNLLSNAIKYRSTRIDQSFISVQMQVNQQQAVFKIVDNGRGIAPESSSKIFDMFFRASTSSTGSGIGLYIVKEAVTALGGTITVSSALRQGSTFTVTLPNVAPD